METGEKIFSLGTFQPLKNDSQYPESWKINPNGDPVKFFHFPGAVRQKREKAKVDTSMQICPGLIANEIQTPYDKHHKVSSLVKSHQNTHNSVKYEVI